MRDTISWVNDEITQMWPITLVVAPAVVLWWRRKWKRLKAAFFQLLRDAIDESAKTAADVHGDDIGAIKEQVANSHQTNLRHDLDAMHSDIKSLMHVNEQHYSWSQEWTDRMERQVDANTAAITDHDDRIAALESWRPFLPADAPD